MSQARTLYQMQITQLKDLTPSVRELYLSAKTPSEFHFKAGQFVMLHVPQAEGKPALRAYSIASSEKIKNGFRLLFKYVQGGVASEFIWSLKGHETLAFTGPFGKVFFKEPPSKRIIFLNTGTGISQHLSFLESKKDLYPDLEYHLFFGVRSEAEIYGDEDLKQLQKELKNFHYHYVLSRPGADWMGKKGYVQDFLKQLDWNNGDTSLYLCGNGGMIKEVKALAKEQGFDSTRLMTEAFD